MLQMTGIHKAFGQNKVLTGVDFTLKEASVHALMEKMVPVNLL